MRPAFRVFAVTSMFISLVVTLVRPVLADCLPVAGAALTIEANSSIRWFDVTPTSGSAPQRWMERGFADTRWERGSQVPLNTLLCAEGALHKSKEISLYWGPLQTHNYVFRQAFTLPNAKRYAGSLDIGAVFGNGVAIYLNSRQVDSTTRNGFLHDDIGKYLVAGTNIIGIAANASTTPCNALTYTLTIHPLT